MRNIVNISLPKELKNEVNRAVKSGHYASTSEFFRDLLRYWQAEEKILKELIKSQREIDLGGGSTLNSLRDFR